jgi:hypothetical protein
VATNQSAFDALFPSVRNIIDHAIEEACTAINNLYVDNEEVMSHSDVCEQAEQIYMRCALGDQVCDVDAPKHVREAIRQRVRNVVRLTVDFSTQ